MKLQVGLWVVAVVLILSISLGNVRGAENLSATFYGNWGCSICHEKHDLIVDYVSLYPEINATYLWIPYNISFTDYYTQLAVLGEVSPPPPPAVVLNRSGTILVLYSVDITRTNLDAWRLGYLVKPTEFTVWIAFITGLIVGLSACMLLLLSVLGTSLTMVKSRSKYFTISLGLIVGLVSAYLIVSIIFLAVVNALSIITYLKYIFGGGLLFIGIWQVVEFRKEKSVIFGTPDQVKYVIKGFMEKGSGFYALLIGFIFAFIKIPCFGAPYLQLLFFSQRDPLLSLLVLSYFIGMLMPIIGILIAIRVGFQSERVNKFRINYRPYLRLLSGILIITLTLYLFLDLYISLDVILWVLLGECAIFAIVIWSKSRREQAKFSAP